MLKKISMEYGQKREIVPMGTVLKVDLEGFLVGQSSIENLQSPWKEAVEDIRDAYVTRWGELLHSVYVRGSVSRGTPIEGVSDIDTVAFVNDDPDDIEGVDKWVSSVEKELRERYPFCTKVEVGLRPVEGIITGQNRVARPVLLYDQIIFSELTTTLPAFVDRLTPQSLAFLYNDLVLNF